MNKMHICAQLHEFTVSFCYFTLCFTSLPYIVNELGLYIAFTAGHFHESERCAIIEESVEGKEGQRVTGVHCSVLLKQLCF